MLLSEKEAARSRGGALENKGRFGKVRKSMARLKFVLGERSKEYKKLKEEAMAPVREAAIERKRQEKNTKKWQRYTQKKIQRYAASKARTAAE